MDFEANVEVNRLLADGSPEDSTPIGFDATIRVWCKDCDEKFRWIGVPYGLSPRQPMLLYPDATVSAFLVAPCTYSRTSKPTPFIQ